MIEDETRVTRKQESIITLILVVLIFKLLAMFWLQTVWMDKEETDRHRARLGIIIEIRRIPSKPRILVVKILYKSPNILIDKIMSRMLLNFFDFFIVKPPKFLF